LLQLGPVFKQKPKNQPNRNKKNKIIKTVE
jgi:hypothetical protein